MRKVDANHLSTLAQGASAGDRRNLEELLQTVSDDIYGLALRMLWNPADAEDATQEILIKLTTRLSLFGATEAAGGDAELNHHVGIGTPEAQGFLECRGGSF